MQESNAQDVPLKRFSDFAEEPSALEGDKVPIDSVLNKELVVTGYRIGKTKFGRNTDDQLLTMEITIAGAKHIIFSGSKVLTEQIYKYADKIPFIAEIVKINKYYRLK